MVADVTETTLTWTPTNWITVVLMVVLGYAALAAVGQAYHYVRGRKA